MLHHAAETGVQITIIAVEQFDNVAHATVPAVNFTTIFILARATAFTVAVTTIFTRVLTKAAVLAVFLATERQLTTMLIP